MSKLLQYLVNKPSVHHKVLPNLQKMQMAGTVLPKMQKAGQYPVERDATSMNTPALSKMFGAQREIDVNRFSEEAFKQKYKMTPHQYKMRTDSDYAQAFERQMDQRRQNDPNYSEINLPATDVRSKLYRGNPNLALIPKGATGPARAQQEQLFADMTSLSAPLLPVKSLVRGFQVGKAASTAPKIIDKLISTPPRPIKTAATQSVDNSGLIINEDVYRQWSNARRKANIPEPSSTTTSANIPSYMENWGTGNWNANINVPAQNIEPYRAAWEGIERRGPEWITEAVRDWPASNMSFSNTPSLLSNVTRGIDQKLGRFFSKGTNAPVFDADEVTRLINENLSKGVGVKKENLPLQVRVVPTGYSPDDFRIETLIDNNKVGSIFFQRNMNPYKPKTFSQQFLNKAQSPFEKWQSTPGFRKKGDYPFSDYDSFNPVKDPTGKTFNTVNDLYNTGISGEFNKAINEAFKAKGLGNVLSGGTGHSKMGESRWQNLVKKGLAEDLGAGYFRLKKQGGPVILPKMQMAGQNNNLPQRVSINDPRYAELYKNRQVGSFYDGAYSLPDLDEVTVTGKDERVKEGMLQGSGRFYQGLAGVMGSPQTGLMEVITGKQQTPSQAWGFDTKGKSWYSPKSISNFAMDAVLDPMNALGVGLIDDVTRGAVRLGAKQAARRSANYLTTKTPLKNTYKYNPLALKDDDVEILQRWDFDNERNISLQSGVVPDEYTGRWYGSNWDNENLQRVHTSVPNYMQIRPGSGQIKTAVVRKGSADLPEEMTKPGFRSFYSQPDTERILPKDATFTSKRVDINPFDSPNDAVEYDETAFTNAWRDSRKLANEALPKPNWLTGYNSNVNRNVTNEILDNASNYLTTKTSLKNAYKINPWAFKPNSKSYYRGLGQAGLEDAFETGVLRANATGKNLTNNRVYSSPFFDTGRTELASALGDGIISEVSGFPMKEFSPNHLGVVPYDINTGKFLESIPVNENVKFLQKDWLKGFKPIKEKGGPVQLPKMQKAGQYNALPLTISMDDPRYPEMYKNRQVGAYYDGAFTMPPLDEVVVRGKDERIKEGMSQGINKFYGHASELMSLPQTEMMKFLTGKRQTPSQAWGFDTTNKSWYHPKTVSNFLMDAALDPTNLAGVGIVDDLTKGAIRASAQNTLSKTLQRGISPFDYSVENILRMPQNLIRTAAGKSKQFSNSVQSNIKSNMAPFILQGLKNREDAWSVYLGLKPEFNSMRVVGYDDATGLTKYEYTNPSVFGTASRRPNPKARKQDQRIDQGLYDSSEGTVYNKRILQSDYGDNSDIIDLNVPGSSTVGNDRLFGVMGGFQKYVSPDGKNLMYRDVWDIQPFSRLTSSQLPRDMVGNAIRRFEVSSLIPGARPFVAEGKLGDIKTKFLPSKPYENIKTKFDTELENLKSIDPEGFANDPKKIREEARRLLAERIKNERTFLNSVEGQGLRKYVDTNPYTRFGDTTPDLAGFDFNPLIPIPKSVLGNIKKVQDFANQPVTKFNMGGPIVDSRGQWVHPGKRTIVPTPTGQITMKGVPYPVYGEDETGFGQMMYPGGEYTFPGQMVDEIPMMQFGGGALLGPPLVMSKIVPGIINMFSGDPLKKFIKWVNEPSETTSSSSALSSAPVKAPVRTYGYDDTYQQYSDKAQEVYDKLNANDNKPYNSPKAISLSSGRFAGAKVDPEMINDIVKAAKDNNVDPWLMLSLVGRESTFGSGAWENKLRSGSKQDLVSGWNVAEEYMPYEFNRFLADKQVPGIKVHKDYHGWNYQVVDEKAVDNYLKKNPQLIDSYYKKIESTPDLGALDSFALAAQRIKKKGIQNYNPGDPKYASMINEDMNLLKNDAAIRTYMKTLGYKYGGISKMQKGGGSEDSTLENIIEFIDPSGITSWDDATAAYQSWKKSGKKIPSLNQGLDMFGAVPGLGKFGKLKYLANPNAMKAAYKFFPWQQTLNVIDSAQDELEKRKSGGQYGGLDRWFAEKWVDVKTGKACGRQEGESRAGYPACRPSKRVSSETPKTSSEMSSAEKAKFKRTKTSSERIPYNHKK
jgi:hypothetical protein